MTPAALKRRAALVSECDDLGTVRRYHAEGLATDDALARAEARLIALTVRLIAEEARQ